MHVLYDVHESRKLVHMRKHTCTMSCSSTALFCLCPPPPPPILLLLQHMELTKREEDEEEEEEVQESSASNFVPKFGVLVPQYNFYDYNTKRSSEIEVIYSKNPLQTYSDACDVTFQYELITVIACNHNLGDNYEFLHN